MVINHCSYLTGVRSVRECGTSTGRKGFGPTTVNWSDGTGAPAQHTVGFSSKTCLTLTFTTSSYCFTLFPSFFFFFNGYQTLAGFACFFQFQHTSYPRYVRSMDIFKSVSGSTSSSHSGVFQRKGSLVKARGQSK